MFSFLTRRVVTAIGVLIVASYVFYILAANAGDPLEDLRTSNQRNKDELIAARTEALHLDVPVFLRYFLWFGGAAKCLIGQCDLGTDYVTGQSVTDMVSAAVGSTFQLISTALILAIIIGVGVGIVSALRQYTGFDYGVTLASFLLYSLPSFFVAVLLKQWVAIGFNDFLADPVIPPLTLAAIGLVVAVIAGAGVGGAWRRRLIVGGGIGVITAGVLAIMSATGWFETPSLGPVVILVIGAGLAYLITFLSAGVDNRRALYTALTVAALGGVGWFVFQQVFRFATTPLVIGAGVGFIVLAAFVGWLWGGPDRRISMRTGGLTGLLVYGLLYLDYAMKWWEPYVNSSAINGRPIATVGSSTPQLAGSGYWVQQIDTFTHLLLPVTAIVLISLASYTRYARGSLLEVLNLDYIRTARAKGINERGVIMRHAFRNALIPLATIIPLDLASLVGGAVITETIFGWNGMGRLFVDALAHSSQDVLMGYFLVVSAMLLLGNILADLLYAVLDPRIRLQ